MSRSYRKKYLRLGNCWGSNTEYYRTKRRQFRRKAKQQLHIKLEDFVHPEKLKVFKDYWDEPTDGSWLADIKYLKKHYANSRLYKLIYKLKPNEERN